MDFMRTVTTRFLLCVLLQQISRVLMSDGPRQCENRHVPENTIRRVVADDFVDRALHRSFNLIPPLRRNLAKESITDIFFNNVPKRSKVYNIFGDRSCPNTTNSETADVIARSTCPWYIYMDKDEDRLPRVMAFASCRCRACVSQAGNVCVPVYSYPTVLRRICRVDGYQYIPVTEKHPVGCTCAVVRDITMKIVVKPNRQPTKP